MYNRDYDRTDRNESDGKTAWYDEDGVLDSITETPDDEEW